ncbi:MAG: hypothetical protein WC782_03190 [Methylococcaceae bacterium]|jgi:hypothetical protein
MKAFITKIVAITSIILLNACAYYPHNYAYSSHQPHYPNQQAYGSNYGASGYYPHERFQGGYDNQHSPEHHNSYHDHSNAVPYYGYPRQRAFCN